MPCFTLNTPVNMMRKLVKAALCHVLSSEPCVIYLYCMCINDVASACSFGFLWKDIQLVPFESVSHSVCHINVCIRDVNNIVHQLLQSLIQHDPSFLLDLVEVGGFEPPSENGPKGLSPSAYRILRSLPCPSPVRLIKEVSPDTRTKPEIS